MEASCFKHSLTEKERSQFNSNGYIVVRNALDQSQVDYFVETIDRINDTPQTFFFKDNCIKLGEQFLNVIDNPRTFPKIWGILGYNIFIYHSHLSSTPFCGSKNDKGLPQWHRDNGRLNDETSECKPAPRISAKIGYFLSDTMEPNMGNLMVVPGSHLENSQPNFKKHVQLNVKAGDACIFDRRLWHAPGSNCSKKVRYAMFYAYAYRWMRPNDTFDDDFLDKIDDPIRKQLLGHPGYHANRPPGYSYYQPTLDEVPLRKFLIKHKKS